MTRSYSDGELEAYLDDSLPPPQLAAVETALRADPELLGRLAAINQRRNAGVHTLGEIWRRHRLTCLSREQLGSFLLGTLAPEEASYIEFHIHKVGCSLCHANLLDLERQQREAAQVRQTRRRRYFESSAGLLRGRP
ncbi:MAG: hypothetical protein U0939_10820 [Pirellulales bacterium]